MEDLGIFVVCQGLEKRFIEIVEKEGLSEKAVDIAIKSYDVAVFIDDYTVVVSSITQNIGDLLAIMQIERTYLVSASFGS